MFNSLDSSSKPVSTFQTLKNFGANGGGGGYIATLLIESGYGYHWYNNITGILAVQQYYQATSGTAI